jgi:hypothetical protein
MLIKSSPACEPVHFTLKWFLQRGILNIPIARHAEAVAAHRVEGLSESDARREALAELGDAEMEGNRFRKQHLTVNDAEIVEREFVWSWGQFAGPLLPIFLDVSISPLAVVCSSRPVGLPKSCSEHNGIVNFLGH